MAISQFRSKRKVSGSVYVDFKKKKLRDLGNRPVLTKIGKRNVREVRTMGGSQKQLLVSIDTANVLDPKTKKHMQAKILTVVKNPANPNYVRRNVMTKGTIIKTDKGEAKITSRPGQQGFVNAVLVQ